MPDDRRLHCKHLDDLCSNPGCKKGFCIEEIKEKHEKALKTARDTELDQEILAFAMQYVDLVFADEKLTPTQSYEKAREPWVIKIATDVVESNRRDKEKKRGRIPKRR